MVCDKDEKEDIYHFILHCTAYKQERSHSTHIQQPYIESNEDILGHFLFVQEDIEEKKEVLLYIYIEVKFITILAITYYDKCKFVYFSKNQEL